jgi:hypothetical protein
MRTSPDDGAGPGSADDTDWEQRTGGVEGPVLAALRPLSANAVASKVADLFLPGMSSCHACMHACEADARARHARRASRRSSTRPPAACRTLQTSGLRTARMDI